MRSKPLPPLASAVLRMNQRKAVESNDAADLRRYVLCLHRKGHSYRAIGEVLKVFASKVRSMAKRADREMADRSRESTSEETSNG